MQLFPTFPSQFADSSPIAGHGKDRQGYKGSDTALYVKQVPLVEKTIETIVKVEDKMQNRIEKSCQPDKSAVPIQGAYQFGSRKDAF
jgi:hypothetical protein